MPSASGPGLYKGLEDKEAVFYVEMGKRSGGLDIKVEGKKRERERYCIKEEEKYFLKIEREKEDKRIFLWIVRKRERKRETVCSLDVYNGWREVLNVLCERGL